MKRFPISPLILAASLLAFTSTARAVVSLTPLFSDHMVLQAGKPAPVWGKADPHEKVTVTINGQTKTAEAGDDGKWSVTLDPLTTGEPTSLTIQGAGNTRTISDVLVGEVWLCAGQSNMALPVSKAQNFTTEQPAATFPKIRTFAANKWIVCSPETVGGFSAAAYFFGREIHQKINQPIGLINASAGGTPIELWTSLAAQQAVPELKPLFEAPAVAAPAAGGGDATQAESDQKQAVEVEGKQAVAVSKVSPGYLFEGRIMPLVPYAIRGTIWYQGEANSYTIHANLYGIQLATMIKEWRSKWGYDFPFITVQLPNIGAPQTDPVQTHGRVLVREGELQSLSLPNTGLAVTIGTGELKSNHPLNKQECGRRLAQWALATVYDQKDVAASGPLPESNKIADGKVIITFSHTDKGLVAQGGGELKGFAIAGADMKFVWANATIDGDTVIVSSPEVKDPVAVRYAWAINPASSNLANGAGLPATPFRTDKEPLTNAYMH